MRRLQTGSCNLFSWRITNCRVSVTVSMSAGQPLACTVGSVISYIGEAHRVTVFLLRIQTRRLRVTNVTTVPEWHASTSHDRTETVSPSCVPAIAYVSHLIFSGSTRVWKRYILYETTQTGRCDFISRTITNFWCEYYGRLVPSASVLGVSP